MQLPVDVKAVIDEATNIEGARQTPIKVNIYMDESSPGDLQALVRQSFASASSHAQVSIVYFPSFPVMVQVGSDIAVIVAGLDPHIGSYAQDLRQAGVPVMVVTTLPDLVMEINQGNGNPLLVEDLIAPSSLYGAKGLPEETGEEPFLLDEESSASMRNRMGEWVIEACRDRRLAFALAFAFVRRPLSLEAVGATSMQNAGIGLVVFLPGADLPLMTLNQAKMLLQIAAAYGEPMNLERVKELAAVVAGGFACRAVARQLVGCVPVLGWAIKAGVGYAGTCAMGHAAIEYFEGGGSIAHLAGVAVKARDKVAQAAHKVAEKPSVKAAVQSVSKKAGALANEAMRQAVPVATSVVDSAMNAASDAGVIPGSAAKAADIISDTVVKKFKKD